MNQIQALIDGLNAHSQRERADTQMTLGEMIATLEAMAPEAKISGLEEAHSYRGYYSDLAFEPREGIVKASDLLTECRSAMGRAFQGYKGGAFVMGELTPVWIASYGDCGLKLLAINPDGTLETAADEF